MEITIVDNLHLERLELGQGWHALNLRWCESHNSHSGLTREAPAKTLGPSVPHLRAEKEELDNTARRFDASLPGSRVILGPDMHILIQVVGAQDGGISREVLEVVHYDNNKEIQHLGAKGANRSREETIGVGERDTEIQGKEEQTRWGRGANTNGTDTKDTDSEGQ